MGCRSLVLSLVLATLSSSAMAFGFQPLLPLGRATSGSRAQCSVDSQITMISQPSRRDFIGFLGFGAAALPWGPLTLKVDAAEAKDDAARIKAGYDTLVDLLDNWEKYAGKGEEANGDNVRRQVGTVGNKSPLFGIRKVLLRQGVDIDLFESFDKAITQIDADAYSAIFADASVAPKRGYQYMADSKQATKECLKIYKEIMDSLSIPY